MSRRIIGVSCILAGLIVIGCRRGVPVEEISPTSSVAEVAAFEPRQTDWPGWRGPAGNGHAPAIEAPIHWDADTHVVWQADVPGRGHSSPVVCGNLVLLATALEAEQQQWVLAFDRETGLELWRTQLHNGRFPPARQMHPKGSHANSTVACDDQCVFVAFLNDDAVTASALDFQGRIVWQTRLGAFRSKFGYAPSPVVYGSLVIFAADNGGGGYLAAVHRRTGAIVWRKARSRSSSYSTAMVAQVDGRDQLLISGGDQVCSYDPATGELLWSCRGTADATCGTMVWNDSLVFASGGYPDKQTLAIRADGSAEVVWSNRVNNYEPSMIVVDDALYATTDNGIAYCWDAATGKEQWKKRLGGSFSASPVYCGGYVYACNSSGTTFVFRASPSSFELVAKNQLGDDTYASPAICDGRIYLRVGVQTPAGRAEKLYLIGP